MYGIKNLKLYDNTLCHLEETIDNYSKYVDMVANLTKRQYEKYMVGISTDELINNSSLENEDSFLISLYLHSKKNNSVHYIRKKFSTAITIQDINELHSKIIAGTNSDFEQNRRYRDGTYIEDYTKWVGYFHPITGEKVIDYIPLNPELVIPTMEKIVFYNNEDTKNPIYGNLFLKPMILHGGIAAIQPFADGNTRTARLIQYGNLWKQTNKFYNTDFSCPILYFSNRYKVYRGNYRANIKDIAVEQNDDAWNRWFDFNMNMIDEQIYKMTNTLQDASKILK